MAEKYFLVISPLYYEDAHWPKILLALNDVHIINIHELK